MEAGKLRHTIILQSPTIIEDTGGAHSVTWTDRATVKASIEALSVREQFMAAQDQASATHRIRFRLRTSLRNVIDASWRVLFGVRVFILVGMPVNVDERNREMQLLCEEGLKVE